MFPELTSNLTMTEQSSELMSQAQDTQTIIMQRLSQLDGQYETYGRDIWLGVQQLMRIIIDQQNTISYELGKRSVLRNETGKEPTFDGTVQKKTVKEVLKQDKTKEDNSARVLIIHPKQGTTINAEVTKKKLQEGVNVKDKGIKIKELRKIRGSGVIVEAETTEDRDKLMNEIKLVPTLNSKFELKKISKKNPTIIVYAVDGTYTEEEFIEQIAMHNEGIEKQDIKVKGQQKKESDLSTNWILETTPQAFQQFVSLGKVKIQWSRYNTKEYIRPTICYNCGKYGHISRFCRGDPKCDNCGQEPNCNKARNEYLSVIIEHHFPKGDPTTISIPKQQQHFEDFTIPEVEYIIRSMPDGKAPGPDQIPISVIRKLFEEHSEWFVGVLNICFNTRKFPRAWKIAKLALIPKEGKCPTNPAAYRHICLLSIWGKVLDKL